MTAIMPESPPRLPAASPQLREVTPLLARYPLLCRRALVRLISLVDRLSAADRIALRGDPLLAAKLTRVERDHAPRLQSGLPGAALAIVAGAALLLVTASRLAG